MKKGDGRLKAMSPEERQAFCRDVLERFSDLVEGEAPPDFCYLVEEVLGDCPPFKAYRNTFTTTIALTRELGASDVPPPGFDEEALERCAERVRRALAEGQH